MGLVRRYWLKMWKTSQINCTDWNWWTFSMFATSDDFITHRTLTFWLSWITSFFNSSIVDCSCRNCPHVGQCESICSHCNWYPKGPGSKRTSCKSPCRWWKEENKVEISIINAAATSVREIWSQLTHDTLWQSHLEQEMVIWISLSYE